MQLVLCDSCGVAWGIDRVAVVHLPKSNVYDKLVVRMIYCLRCLEDELPDQHAKYIRLREKRERQRDRDLEADGLPPIEKLVYGV